MTDNNSAGNNKSAPRGRKPRSAISSSNELVDEDKSKAMPRGMKSKMKTRQKLIDSAQRAIANKGFDQTTIEDITTGADVGFGTFYNHFRSKEDIAVVLMLGEMIKIDAVVDEINLREADRAVSICYIQKLILTKVVHNEVWGWFMVQSHASHKLLIERFNKSATRDISDGVKQGRFDVGCVVTAAQISIASLISGMSSLLEHRAKPSIASETVECLMRMYGLDHVEAKNISKLELPEYAVELFKSEKY